ncbi:MAG: GMP synthase [Calditrichaeota bacterium]|nr:MAG: GMP synthase [Calditrichota bacterium]
MAPPTVKVAILDLYNNEPNQGLRCLRDIIEDCNRRTPDVQVTHTTYEVRYKNHVPGLEYDIYISSGGPGSPFDGEGKVWEKRYFNLLDAIWSYNQQAEGARKYIFFICHSFQMMCRFFNLARIRRRQFYSFGIFPMRKTPQGQSDFLLRPLPEPYYAADFRQFEVVQPNAGVLQELGAEVLSLESASHRPEGERALMAIRISPEVYGTQYHPEADPVSMLYHFRQPERKQQVVAEHGEAAYRQMIEHLEDPEYITLTRKNILPRFLMHAIHALYPESIG